MLYTITMPVELQNTLIEAYPGKEQSWFERKYEIMAQIKQEITLNNIIIVCGQAVYQFFRGVQQYHASTNMAQPTEPVGTIFEDYPVYMCDFIDPNVLMFTIHANPDSKATPVNKRKLRLLTSQMFYFDFNNPN